MTAHLIAIIVTMTSYQPIASQTDSSPTWTSIGDRTSKFGVAVSQDLLKSGVVHYGDVIWIPGRGYRIVNDCMGLVKHEGGKTIPIKKAIDLLVFTHAEEKEVGERHNVTIYKVEVRQ